MKTIRQPPAVSQDAQPTPLATRPYVVVNPIARRASSALAEIFRQCRARGVPVPTVVGTTAAEPGSSQASEAVGVGADLVIVIGGDGTVRRVARELAGTRTRLAIVALGSGNVLAYNLGLTSLDMASQVGVALGSTSVALDIGWARVVSGGGQVTEEPFLTMAGIGRDAQTVAQTGLAAKLRLGWAAYAIQGMRHALRPPLPMRVRLDDLPERQIDTWTVLACITPAAPGGVIIHPDAQADDGCLDVLEVPIKHPGQWLPVAVKGLLHPRLPVAALRYRKAQRLRVRPINPLPVQLDGDVITDVTSLEAHIQPRCLRVQVPMGGL